MEASNTAPEKQRLSFSFSIPLESAIGQSPSIRNLRAQQGLNESQLSFRIPTNEDAAIHVHDKHGQHSWQAKILRVLHARWFQRTMLSLLILDILILFTELFLMATYPTCNFIIRDALSCCPPEAGAEEEAHRWLGSDSHHDDICMDPNTEVADYTAGCDPHKYHAVHTLEDVLFGFTIAILSAMMLEILCLMAAITPCVFFRHFWYTLDFFIVSVSLALEALFKSASEDELATYAGLLVLFRCWRFVRITHGLIEVTAELTSEKYEEVVKQAIELEDLMAKHEEKMARQGMLESSETDSLREIREVSKSLADNLLKTQHEDSEHTSGGHLKEKSKEFVGKISHLSHGHKSHTQEEKPNGESNLDSNVEEDVDLERADTEEQAKVAQEEKQNGESNVEEDVDLEKADTEEQFA